MRLIDADALADALFEKRKDYPQWVADTIGNMPEAVIRCKDCKYAHKTYDGDCKYCDMFTDDDGNPIERYRSGDWFCADGERRTDDESIQAEMKAYRDILNGVKEQPTIPYDMKWNPDCEDCLPEGIEDCIECHKRQKGR